MNITTAATEGEAGNVGTGAFQFDLGRRRRLLSCGSFCSRLCFCLCEPRSSFPGTEKIAD